ncbi:hypothetical protein [Glycomyces artemisiae]|uniref:Class 3 adenylate cyclase n=1 Tax=Glycomyces artemisiae TaxID=1076443 RepID=A0A2T0UJ13_9ACTN|nr:hypothetical protein [Glycomyces artemisiae]PRY57856.1 hypothetical protein B0I28_106279 [Glycomyces artemisiae]
MPSTPYPAAQEFLTVVALDIEGFSRFTDAEGTRIATHFRDAVHRAFDRADLSQLYENPRFMQNGGDGLVLGFPQPDLGKITDRVPSALQGELRELHRSEGFCIRMRMGVSVGPVEKTDDPRIDVAPGRTIIDACRIADAAPTRRLLKQSDPHATYLVVAVTQTVMDSTVDRNPLWLRASEFVKMEIDIKEKHYHATAFMHVPSPSGKLLSAGLLNLDDTDSIEAEMRNQPPLEERYRARHRADKPSDGPRYEADRPSAPLSTGDVSGKGAFGVVSGGRVQVDNSEDHRGQDRSHTTNYINGDNFTAERDAYIDKSTRSDDEERHRPFWERDDRP